MIRGRTSWDACVCVCTRVRSRFLLSLVCVSKSNSNQGRAAQTPVVKPRRKIFLHVCFDVIMQGISVFTALSPFFKKMCLTLRLTLMKVSWILRTFSSRDAKGDGARSTIQQRQIKVVTHWPQWTKHYCRNRTFNMNFKTWKKPKLKKLTSDTCLLIKRKRRVTKQFY